MPHRRSTLRLGRLAGVPVGIQPLWLLIVGLITYALGHDYFPARDPGLSPAMAYVLGLLSAVALFGGILLHELGHAVVARRRGMEVDEIDLWLLGGVSRMHGEPRQPQDEVRFAAAGPAVTTMILLVLVPVRIVVGGTIPASARAFLDYQLYATSAILAFNLLPAFPLDGGRIIRALLWRRSGDRCRATERAAAAGRIVGWMLVIAGLLLFAGGMLNGLWFAVLGGFLILAGAAEAQGTQPFAGMTVADLMTAAPITIAAELTLEEAASARFAHDLFTAFPVVDRSGRAVGLVRIDDVRDVPAALRAQTSVAHVMVVDPALRVPRDAAVTDVVARPAFVRVGRAVVVDGHDRPVGLLSSADLEHRMRGLMAHRRAVRTSPNSAARTS
jgi:Zn-dependent protease/CBS domain-containing protein